MAHSCILAELTRGAWWAIVRKCIKSRDATACLNTTAIVRDDARHREGRVGLAEEPDFK